MSDVLCYAIVGKSGMHWSESCISAPATSGDYDGVLEYELEYARDAEPEEDYKIVGLVNEGELESLRQDKDRMDWIIKNANIFDSDKDIYLHNRKAIDEAMKVKDA